MKTLYTVIERDLFRGNSSLEKRKIKEFTDLKEALAYKKELNSKRKQGTPLNHVIGEDGEIISDDETN